MERYRGKFLCTLKCHWQINILVSLYPCMVGCSDGCMAGCSGGCMTGCSNDCMVGRQLDSLASARLCCRTFVCFTDGWIMGMGGLTTIMIN